MDGNDEAKGDKKMDVDLATWQSPDGIILKKTLKTGEDFLRPLLESVCSLNIQISSKIDEAVLAGMGIPTNGQLEFTLGMAETETIRILEKCLMTMRKNEESEFTIKISRDKEMQPETSEKEALILTFILTLQNFSEVKPIWALMSEEKYNLAVSHKERGTHFFKDGKIEAAFIQYSLAVKYLVCIYECSSVINDDPEPAIKTQRKEYLALECICYLNLAACQSKVENHQSVIANCTCALELESSNVKGLYRRAQAYKACGRLEEARADLKQAMKIEPRNHAVVSLLQACH